MDPTFYQHLVLYLTSLSYPPTLDEKAQRRIQGESRKFQVIEDTLYKKNKANPDSPLKVIQEDEVPSLLKRLHDDPTSGHMGIDSTFNKAKQRYYWPQMFEDIRTHNQHCAICQKQKRPHTKEALHPIPVEEPFDRVGIDLLQLPLTTSGNKYVIVATDYHTKWVEAQPIPNKTASIVAGFLYEEVICKHGSPKVLLSDQGTEFLNTLVKQICTFFEIKHRTTTPYHPQTNGLTERFNRTLINILGKLTQQHKGHPWDELLSSALLAYRTTPHSTTGYTPFFLMYGREAVLPLEHIYPTHHFNLSGPTDTEEWILQRLKVLNGKLQDAQAQAQRRITLAQHSYKERYDRTHKAKPQAQYKIGDQVLKARVELSPSSANKLEPKMIGPYYIHEVGASGIYKLRLPSGRILNKFIHGNHLKLYLPPIKPQPFVLIP